MEFEVKPYLLVFSKAYKLPTSVTNSQSLPPLSQLSLKATEGQLRLTRLIALSPILHAQSGMNVGLRLY